MERVTGIGGVFFRADDPEQLGRWYAEHLGVDPAPESYDVPSWWQQAGPTVFTPMAADSDTSARLRAPGRSTSAFAISTR